MAKETISTSSVLKILTLEYFLSKNDLLKVLPLYLKNPNPRILPLYEKSPTLEYFSVRKVLCQSNSTVKKKLASEYLFSENILP